MGELNFQPVQITDYDRVYEYTSAYGENSCQHSPVSMFSLAGKYDDHICIEDGFLYIMRDDLCDDTYRVYLAPLGGGDLKKAYENIFADAAAHGKKSKFLTLTQKHAEFLEKEFPGRFDISEERDLAEYVYFTEKMSEFSGKKLRKRRQEVAKFFEEYGDRVEIKLIEKSDHEDIIQFEKEWVVFNSETHDEAALLIEQVEIKRQLSVFDELHLSGIILRIDGEVHGFGYGTKLNDDCFDAIIEKGDRGIPNIYKVLRRESVRMCALDCTYINLEEDVGSEGLRNLKLAYQPEYLISKYIVTEVV